MEDDYQSKCDGEFGGNRRGEGVEGVDDDYQSECDGDSGG